MLDYPLTIEQARIIKYGSWGGNPTGNKYRENDCAWEVFPSDGWHSYQCCRKNGYGPEGLYCKQHAKKVEK